MKKQLLWLGLAFVSLTFNTTATQLAPLPQQSKAAYLSAEVLTRYHYKRIPLDDGSSAIIFDNYLKTMDGEKVFFLQSDIDQFASYRNKLDDAILNEDLAVPFTMFNLYQQRVAERYSYARTLLARGFDFDSKES